MSDTTKLAGRGRFSSRRKAAAVLRLLRGEDLELVSRELGVTAATLPMSTILSASRKSRSTSRAGRR